MWKVIARFIITRKIYIVTVLFLMIVLGAFHVEVHLTKSEAKLLPAYDSVWINFKNFRKTFGQEDNIIVIGFKDKRFFQPKNFKSWHYMIRSIARQQGIQKIISIDSLSVLSKNDSLKKFEFKPLYPNAKFTTKSLQELQKKLKQYPFYQGIIYNKGAYQTIIYLNPSIVDTELRIKVVNYIKVKVHQYEKETGINLYLSGIPVIRTNNAQELSREAAFYILGALFITSLIFFLFFRSFRVTFISLIVVLIAVLMVFASLHLFHYELTALTALVPPLMIVIGIPNCVFLVNKYQQEFKVHRNKIKALQRTIMKVGNAALMTNFTTAFAFLTFIFTDSDALKQFGLIASMNIIGIFFLSLLIVPIGLSFISEPKPRHLRHLEKKWMNQMINRIQYVVINKRKLLYTMVFIVIILSIFGITMIQTSGNMLDDLAKNKEFYQDISFFDENLRGILPLEIMIDTKHPRGAMKLSTLKRINKLNQFIDSLKYSSSPISINRLVKFAKQAYYNGNPSFYSLPNKREKNFILSYAQNTLSDANILKNYIDSTVQKTRITTYVKNLSTKDLEYIFNRVAKEKNRLFPKSQFNTYLSGASLVFLKGTYYLFKNLLISITLAIIIIAVLMSVMFASPRMVLVSLLPNLIPIMTTAGFMGYFGIPLKPSTILVFSIAFGIAVDNTIHFLAKYRQELKVSKGDIYYSVLNALREMGISMFYTSIVLFFGFAIFMFSNFGGTVALGGLISLTLLVAVVSDLILLPALLLSFQDLTDKNFVHPKIDLFKDEEAKESQSIPIKQAEKK